MKDINKRKSIQHAKLITELCISAVIMLSAGYIVYKGSSRTRIVEKSVELDTETTLALSELVLQNIKSARSKLKQIIKKMDDIEKYREQEVSHFDKDVPARSANLSLYTYSAPRP